ncbi:hypothetical protein GGR32_001468 [Mesonia hippocampi]|uniref:Glycosyltransferase n=1 Tax=Mesonia hippocampi TaxID=1628250 RepID=A0A840EIL2_9FLAO|nr:glycosyltransferase family 2 protein [Mesonia hippocampi]MBB4119172.1 hypothetical protein [Mesonia hippocampi]
MKTTLLISTYNWPEALNLVLASVLAQSKLPDELLIADDGSNAETKTVIDAFITKTTLPVKHIWHEDKGFRKSRILNKAIAQAKGDYIIQLDGDCIMHKDFVEDHAALAQKKVYLYGSRVNIQEFFLKELFLKRKIKFGFFAKGIKKRTRNLRIPLFSSFYKPKAEISKKMRGCNLSFWRSDFIAVNGYNEDIEGWGREDSELVLRMLHNGVAGKRLRYRGIIYHIWHKEQSKSKLSNNNQLQEETIRNKAKWCENGVDKYL